MIRLTTTLELNGAVVHSETTPLVDGVWLGDHEQALVPFHGAALHVIPHPHHPLAVSIAGAERPVSLRLGGSLELDLGEGAVVRLEVLREQRLQRDGFFAGDLRLLALTAAIVVFGMWWDTLGRWSATHPEVIAELEALPALWQRIQPDLEVPPAERARKAHQPVAFEPTLVPTEPPDTGTPR